MESSEKHRERLAELTITHSLAQTELHRLRTDVIAQNAEERESYRVEKLTIESERNQLADSLQKLMSEHVLLALEFERLHAVKEELWVEQTVAIEESETLIAERTESQIQQVLISAELERVTTSVNDDRNELRRLRDEIRRLTIVHQELERRVAEQQTTFHCGTLLLGFEIERLHRVKDESIEELENEIQNLQSLVRQANVIVSEELNNFEKLSGNVLMQVEAERLHDELSKLREKERVRLLLESPGGQFNETQEEVALLRETLEYFKSKCETLREEGRVQEVLLGLEILRLESQKEEKNREKDA
eukprot:TRINITY_DN3800_c0_g1_i6.p1 TRINITY_DN3800_c0_g1~~TRINITY_DN3800_c0_g1_i6.p1  ORF type:complete len:305 (-),score=104.51 TRINITY_DN3800_c0_g1_i6:91-1005(-)